jgi:hypothetical protein
MNAEFYPAGVLGFFRMDTPPLVSPFGFVELFRRPGTALARYAAAIVATNVFLFVFYFHEVGRFMAPVGATLIIFSAVGSPDATRALPQRLRARLA